MPEAAPSPPRIHVARQIRSQRHPAHEAPVHPDQSLAHKHVTDDGGQNQQRAEARVHVGVGGVAGLVAPPLQKAPSLRVLFLHLTEADDGQGAEERVGNIDRNERKSGQLLVHIVIVEVRMVDSDVSLHRHSTDDAEPRQREEEHGEAEVLAQRVLSGPRALHVRGDGDRACQQRAQEVRDGQSTHERVKRGFLLFSARFAKNHDGDEIPDHPKNKHDGGDGRDHGPPGHRLIIHGYQYH